MATILIVDDEQDMREMLCQMMQREGHTALGAGNGSEALSILSEESIDLIISDIIMPEKDGLELTLELKNSKSTIPVIAISGGGRISPHAYLPVAQGLGAVRTISKPFEREEIIEAVDAVLNKVVSSEHKE